jgi:hypothetical protein
MTAERIRIRLVQVLSGEVRAIARKAATES